MNETEEFKKFVANSPSMTFIPPKQKTPIKKPLGAKNISKFGMLLGCIIVIVYNAFYLINNQKIPDTEEQMSILMLGWGVASFFSPLIISVILDKFTKK